MTNWNRRAEKRATELAKEAAKQFDATILHNYVYDAVDGQHNHDNVLLRTLHLAEEAYDLADETRDGRLDRAPFDAAGTLDGEVDDLVEEYVAEACADVILDGDAWTDAWDAADIDQAQAEASEWLDDHHDAAERAGVLETVRDKAVEEW